MTSSYMHTGVRAFAAPTKECVDFVAKKGIRNKNIIHNPTVAELYEYALHPDHLTSVDPHVFKTTVSDTGALLVSSGQKMGRSPKEKRTVLDETTKDTIWWGKVNIAIPPEGYKRNRQRVVDYLSIKPSVFVMDGYIGWDPEYRINARIICYRPYHALFMK
jgi:phosphoenolpyruvate carboxykinase (ATP)